jgi:hypothetical protein
MEEPTDIQCSIATERISSSRLMLLLEKMRLNFIDFDLK